LRVLPGAASASSKFVSVSDIFTDGTWEGLDKPEKGVSLPKNSSNKDGNKGFDVLRIKFMMLGF
jgi:hypothetical protein